MKHPLTKHKLLRTCVLLTLLAALPAVSSCGDTEQSGSGTGDVTHAVAAETGTAETADPNDRSQMEDGLPDDLDFSGRTFTVMVANGTEEPKFFVGDEEESGDIVLDTIAARNRAVEERLGITLSFDVHPELDGGTIDGFISKLLMAGDATHDLYTGYQWGLVKIILNGGIVPAEDLTHIDLSRPWWWTNYMDELTIGGGDHYFYVSDFFLGTLRRACTLMFNRDLYANLYDDADELYEIVLDGKWTIDKLAELAKGAYIDLNNDSKTDRDDQLGFSSWAKLASTDPFVYGSDVEFTRRTADGDVELTMISEDAVTLCEKLVDFFWQEGTYTDITSEADQTALFSAGRCLFMGGVMINTVERLRDMEASFGFLPIPKLDEEQKEYKTLIHDAGSPGAVNGNSQNLDIAGAVLEALSSESYRSVTPVYYETALKIKYTRDDRSAQMIDLMHDSLMTNFIYAFNYTLNEIGTQYRALATNNKKDYVSYVEKNLPAAEAKLAALADAFAGE